MNFILYSNNKFPMTLVMELFDQMVCVIVLIYKRPIILGSRLAVMKSYFVTAKGDPRINFL